MEYEEKNKIEVKFMGDGLMAVVQIEENNRCLTTCDFLTSLCLLSTNVNSFIHKMRYPRPLGFRIRVTAGHAQYIEMKTGKTDYVGYPVNLAFKLLEVNSQEPLICHESVKSVFCQDLSPIKFNKITPSIKNIDGVDSDDLNALWSFDCSGEKSHPKCKERDVQRFREMGQRKGVARHLFQMHAANIF